MTTLLDWSARTDLIDLVPLEARTTSGNGPAFNVQPYTGRAMVLLESQPGTGTAPLLSVPRLQDSADGVSGWADVTNELGLVVRFNNVGAAPSLQRIWFDVGATRGFVRGGWNMSGTTPSFTFSMLLLARLT
jgi:hypothetical protein